MVKTLKVWTSCIMSPKICKPKSLSFDILQSADSLRVESGLPMPGARVRVAVCADYFVFAPIATLVVQVFAAIHVTQIVSCRIPRDAVDGVTGRFSNRSVSLTPQA